MKQSKKIKAWAVVRESDGILMWWWDNKSNRQSEVFVRRQDARNAHDEWLRADEITRVIPVLITPLSPEGQEKEEK